MIAGQPGAGKSSIALWHATQWVSRHNLRGIYFSADSSELVQAANYLNAEFSGRTLDEVRGGVMQRLQDERSLYDQLLGLALRLGLRMVQGFSEAAAPDGTGAEPNAGGHETALAPRRHPARAPPRGQRFRCR